MPFCVAGMGDLLALFRCISCRFSFGADPSKPELLGAPGRVYRSGKPELTCNVQQYSRETYLRRAEAAQCRVQSSMLLPVFSIPPGKNNPATAALGVVEVVQTSDDMEFLPVACLLNTVLIKCGLYTSSLEEVKSQMPTVATNLQLPNRTGLLEDAGRGSGSSDIGEVGSADGENQQQRKEQSGHGRGESGIGAGGGGTGGEGEQRGSGDANMRGSDEYDIGNESDEDENDDGDEYEPGRYVSGKVQRRKSLETTRGGVRKNISAGTSTRNGKSNRFGGRNANSGVKLTLADLQGQFGVGLKEAANELGVCTTTLKRACRRHGIQRWPRRALQKVSRTLDEMERRGTFQNTMVEAVPMGSFMHPTTGQFMIPSPPTAPISLPFEEMPVDLRWAALANMIPKLHGGDGIPGAGAFTQQVGAAAGGIPMPSPSDFSLEGAVTMTHGGGNDKNMNQNGGHEGKAVTAGTGMTSGWQQFGTAAAAQAAAAAAAAAQQAAAARRPQPQHLAGIVPAAPTVQILPAVQAPGSFQLPYDTHPEAPILQLPGEGSPREGAAPSEGPGISFPFSQMSLPSFGPSFMMPSSLMGPDTMMPSRASGGNTINGAAAIGAVGGGQRNIHNIPMDDIGLLDSSILELMLAEDSRSLVGASDEELKRMFPSPAQAQAHPL